ncbi:MAG: altronate dehydratase [Phenylobacterium sp.]|uniref:UxaA family hydrolase n=1 Tax=Phenylobacterium sp. TaxID=1871053 RepID=UPI001A4C4A2D|nr:altronate dehydratase family protein [Phenylobacterium sp.]MBL8773309.1 altronate dehydratase [Phenylobacterium sp.]
METRHHTANAAVVRLHPGDNVVIAARRIASGVAIPSEGVATSGPIPGGHKLAARPIRQGEAVLKYGQVIGVAVSDIAAGAHVHSHNLAASDLRRVAPPTPALSGPGAARTFQGFRRANGKVGVRNYIGVLTSVNCSATVARLLAERATQSGLLADHPTIDGIVPIAHTSGCGMAGSGEGFEILRRTLWGAAANPNFGAVLLVGLGCEVLQVGAFIRDYGLAQNPAFQSYTIQDAGGTRRAVEQGLERLADLIPLAAAATRSECPAGELVVGLQCGGSDAWSGVTSNPALGNAVDRLVALGGTAILSETPEVYGAEHLLYARARDSEVAERLKARIAWWKDYTARHGVELDNNPSPGNKAGGLTTILEKSLGAVAKSGTAPLNDVIEYAQPLRGRGLVFMDSPGFDPCSATGQVASGATLIAFTTGRGSAFGCKPSPSIKLSSNTDVYERMREDIDLDCGAIATQQATVAEKGAEILDLMLRVASGEPTASESLGYGAAEFVPWQIGATL